MPSTLTITALSESQEGTIGNDWRYSLKASVYSGALTGEGTIDVAKHDLASGTTQEPPGPPAPLVLAAGEAGDEIHVDLRLTATEVDLLQNDEGTKAVSFKLQNPAAGAPAHAEEREVTVGVTEVPSGVGTAVFVLKLGLRLESS